MSLCLVGKLSCWMVGKLHIGSVKRLVLILPLLGLIVMWLLSHFYMSIGGRSVSRTVFELISWKGTLAISLHESDFTYFAPYFTVQHCDGEWVYRPSIYESLFGSLGFSTGAAAEPAGVWVPYWLLFSVYLVFVYFSLAARKH